ncbi:MAG: aminotransferase class V-fold PLP-dependent enzyme [Clostridia bacterium]|nr:aminotransferase class V-fold PLP-dependent enzyme [Clostridia bacterium]
MNTPILDFVKKYAEGSHLRLHMPGHKGASLLGMERYDITEISGADSLYEASGIIRESEENASCLFSCPTFYSTEGSSQCIRAMLYLALLHKKSGQRPLILAGRNAHKTFLSAAALLDFDVRWIYPSEEESYLSCRVDAAALEAMLASEKPLAVYLTSPDYLGNTSDIPAIAEVCRRHGALLLVDNAHGAYLKFLHTSRHPIDLGADLCCDSAHKTLPALTGAAYLHISPQLPESYSRQAKNALALFGSTSPSYLVLQSLDAVNAYLAGDYRARLAAFAAEAKKLRLRLEGRGHLIPGDEPMKLTISAKPYGYTGAEMAAALEGMRIIPEFADPDFLVLMFTPETGMDGLMRLEEALLSLPRRPEISQKPPLFSGAERLLSIREAALSPAEIIPAEESIGRVLAAATVGCPPAVPIVVCGERIDAHALECFRYYGIESVSVVKDPS